PPRIHLSPYTTLFRSLARFEKEEHAASVITVLDGMSTLAGRNHFREGKLVIQMNSSAPPADVSAARAVLSGHTPDPVPKAVPKRSESTRLNSSHVKIS